MKKGEMKGCGSGSRREPEQEKEKEQEQEQRKNRTGEQKQGAGTIYLSWVGGCAGKPHHLRHLCGYAAGKRQHLALQVNQKGIGLPPTDNLYGAVGDTRLV